MIHILISAGYGLCRIAPGSKRPCGARWQLEPIRDAAAFQEGDAVGIVCGPLSRGVVCVDLDGIDTSLADRLLPATAMEDGRPGRERAHRWYRLADTAWDDRVLPARGGATRAAMDAGLIPRFCGSRNLRAPSDATVGVELKGCGTQATVPPTMTAHGARTWVGDGVGEPAELAHADLLGAVERIGEAIGWEPARAAQSAPVAWHRLRMLDSEILAKAMFARNGEGFRAAWSRNGANSEDDASLVAMLAFWTHDAAQLERLWLSSPCGSREKTRDRQDYRDRTIASVLALRGGG